MAPLLLSQFLLGVLSLISWTFCAFQLFQFLLLRVQLLPLLRV